MATPSNPKGRDGRPLCEAKKRSGGTCTQAAGWGTDHAGTGRCKLHGGSTPNQAKAAARQAAAENARQAARRLGFEPVNDPLTELQSLAGELVAVKDWLRGEVERLEQIRYQGRSGEQIRGELIAYQTALRDTVAVLAVIGRLRIDERLAAIEEAKAAIVVGAINAAIDYLGATGEQADEARRVASRHLKAVA